MSGPQISLLPDGRRLHLHHGPIDLIVEAFGPADARRRAYSRAAARFDGLLEALVAELPALRSPAPQKLRGRVARAMARAIAPHRTAFITPMAAVAGAVADDISTVIAEDPAILRAYVNNGGDIALHLAPHQSLTVAIANSGLSDRVTIAHADPVRGVATSGWRGRSFSLGVADAVTVLATTAAAADAAATLIANAVDLPLHPAIARRPAEEMQPDSDLGPRLVTVGVGRLAPLEVAAALDAGLAEAERMRRGGLIAAAALFLAGQNRTTGAFPGVAETKETARA